MRDQRAEKALLGARLCRPKASFRADDVAQPGSSGPQPGPSPNEEAQASCTRDVSARDSYSIPQRTNGVNG
jgi:hypothetical protein